MKNLIADEILTDETLKIESEENLQANTFAQLNKLVFNEIAKKMQNPAVGNKSNLVAMVEALKCLTADLYQNPQIATLGNFDQFTLALAKALLIYKSNNDKYFQSELIAFAKQFEKLCEENLELQLFRDSVSKLLRAGTAYTLNTLQFHAADQKIAEHAQNANPYLRLYLNNFAEGLKNVRQIVEQEAQQPVKSTSELPVSSLAKDSVNMVMNLQLNASSAENDLHLINDYAIKYQQACSNEPKLKNFFKAVGTLVIAGIYATIGAIAGTALGMYLEDVKGGLEGFYYGIREGFKAGTDRGKKITGLSENASLTRCVFFQPSAAPSAAVKLANKAKTLVNKTKEQARDHFFTIKDKKHERINPLTREHFQAMKI